MVDLAGLETCGFLTLTLGDYHCMTHGKQIPKGKHAHCPHCGTKLLFQQVFDTAEGSRRFHSLYTGLLKDLFTQAIVVSERHQSGAIHFHVLGALAQRDDIRTGYDFREVRARNYSSVAVPLLQLWATLRKKLPRYGFGRAELTPIRKTSGAVASYVSKYIEKTIRNRRPDDKGKKLVRYLGFNKTQLKPNDFEWDTFQAKQWRSRMASALKLVGIPLGDAAVKPAPHVAECVGMAFGRIRAKCLDTKLVNEVIGPKWAYLVQTLLDKLQLNEGDVLKPDFYRGRLLSFELQRLAGRSWCEKADQPSAIIMAGEKFTKEDYRDYFEGYPLPKRVFYSAN